LTLSSLAAMLSDSTGKAPCIMIGCICFSWGDDELDDWLLLSLHPPRINALQTLVIAMIRLNNMICL
ncbi:hypothetical protein, partial [Acinetobacter venetianus]|uniref:hypothetical protein n=1 Tax=Acinetobacter venetianus TaxID=52133 RepID=UPI00241F1861